jgi:hypothetical protein
MFSLLLLFSFVCAGDLPIPNADASLKFSFYQHHWWSLSLSE